MRANSSYVRCATLGVELFRRRKYLAGVVTWKMKNFSQTVDFRYEVVYNISVRNGDKPRDRSRDKPNIKR